MFLLLLSFFAFPAFAEIRLEGLEPKMDEFVAKFQPVENTGISVGVIKDGKLVFVKNYGYRDRENKLPVTENTVFAIGSITKTFVAASLALLKETNRVSFEVPVKAYLPGFMLQDPIATEQANLVDLLSHQTGLPRHDYLWYYTNFSTAELFSKLSFLEVNKDPLNGFRSGRTQYNNLMFMTAGLLLERQTAMPWKQYVHNSFLAPLGMNDTTFDLGGFRSENSAKGYDQAELLGYHSLETVSAAGSINSTLSDMVRWTNFHLSGGQDIRGVPLIKKSSLERLYRAESTWSVPKFKVEMKYGLGMFLSDVEGRKVMWHGGNIDGFSAHFSFMPSEGLGLVVLTNQNGMSNFTIPVNIEVKEGEPRIALFPYMIYQHLLGDVTPPALGASADFRFDLDGIYSAHSKPEILFARASEVDLSPYLGNFSERAYGVISAELSATRKLQLNYYGHMFELVPQVEQNKFALLDERGQSMDMIAEFVFVDGKLIALHIPFEPAVSPIQFLKY